MAGSEEWIVRKRVCLLLTLSVKAATDPIYATNRGTHAPI
jgi:hypothetical protein